MNNEKENIEKDKIKEQEEKNYMTEGMSYGMCMGIGFFIRKNDKEDKE